MKLYLKCSHIEEIIKMNDAYCTYVKDIDAYVDLCEDCFSKLDIKDYSKGDLECNYEVETMRGLK